MAIAIVALLLNNLSQRTDNQNHAAVQRVGATVANIVIQSFERKKRKKCYLQAYQDVQQASNLIGQWQEAINQLNKSIHQLTSSQQVASEDHDDAVVQASLHILALELERGEIEIKIRERRRYIDSLRIVPLELFGDILLMVVEDGMPRLYLALVCRCWRDVVLDVPRIWSKISVNIPPWIKRPREFLRRRIQLAKAVPLDVTLNAACGGRLVETAKKLHSILLATGTSRWRSLTVEDGIRAEDDMSEWTQGLTIKPFSKLRSLELRYRSNSLRDIYIPIYDRIAESSTQLSTCLLAQNQHCIGFLAPSLTDTYFAKLTTLQASWGFVWHTRIPPTLVDLKLLSIAENPSDIEFLKFPSMTSLPTVSLLTMSTWKMDNVTHLTIEQLAISAVPLPRNFMVYLPTLVNLTILHHSWWYLEHLAAPRLQTLSLGIANPGGHPHIDHIDRMGIIFTDGPESWGIRPTIFRLYSALSQTVACLILERWSQLRHVLLCVGEAHRESLITTLRAREAVEGGMDAIAGWKACPDLETLDLEVGSHLDREDHDEWREFASVVLFARRTGRLRQISWGRGSDRRTLTRENVCK